MNCCKIYKALKYRKLQNLFLSLILCLEGGEWYSKTIREIYASLYNIHVGYGTFGCFHTDRIRPNVYIGNYCSIGPNVHMIRANHPFHLFTSHPIIYGCQEQKSGIFDLQQKTLEIGHDVWIGVNAVILPGCSKVGNGAVIGAGAIVTKDVPPYSIVAGVPAKVISMRFTPSQIDRLESSKWWEMDRKLLFENLANIQTILSND